MAIGGTGGNHSGGGSKVTYELQPEIQIDFGKHVIRPGWATATRTTSAAMGSSTTDPSRGTWRGWASGSNQSSTAENDSGVAGMRGDPAF